MKYCFYNSGSYHLFKPAKIVHDLRDGSSCTALEFHKKLARFFNQKDVFITDEKGKPINHNL